MDYESTALTNHELEARFEYRSSIAYFERSAIQRRKEKGPLKKRNPNPKKGAQGCVRQHVELSGTSGHLGGTRTGGHFAEPGRGGGEGLRKTV